MYSLLSMTPGARLLLPHGCRWSVTGDAFLGCGFIEEHGLAFDGAGQFVAFCAAHVLVDSLQREISPLVVVELGWLPLRAVVAFGARSDPALGELFAVDVFVALLAFRRRYLEVHVEHPSLLVGWLVAVHASRGPVRAKQGEGSLGVIEA